MAIERPSPNFDERRAGARIGLIVLHYTGMRSAEAALGRLTDPGSRVSCHYLLDEEGRLYRLVPENRRAWHAGRGGWRQESDVNSVSIGIELQNPGHEWGYRPFPSPQIDALLELLGTLLRKYRLEPEAVIAHSDVAPDRKQDPGELFPWPVLARAGLSIWPLHPVPAPVDALRARVQLTRIGYRVEPPRCGLARVVRAFQRRFRPRRVDGILDTETMGLLDAVDSLVDAGRRNRPEDAGGLRGGTVFL